MARSTNTQFAVAVHVLTYLASAGAARQVSSDELAASANVNPVYVRRVLGPLRDAELTRSVAGHGGGWLLARSAASIRLDEVWSVLVGGDGLLGLHLPNPQCRIGAAIGAQLADIDHAVVDAMLEELRRRTVQDLVDEALAVERVERDAAEPLGPSGR